MNVYLFCHQPWNFHYCSRQSQSHRKKNSPQAYLPPLSTLEKSKTGLSVLFHIHSVCGPCNLRACFQPHGELQASTPARAPQNTHTHAAIILTVWTDCTWEDAIVDLPSLRMQSASDVHACKFELPAPLICTVHPKGQVSHFAHLCRLVFPPRSFFHALSLRPSYAHQRRDAWPQGEDQWTAVSCSASVGSCLEALQVGRISGAQRRDEASYLLFISSSDVGSRFLTHFYLLKD